MEWVEQGIGWLQQLPPLGVLAVIFFIAYIENVFPPSPSDVLLVFAGALIGFGTLGFVPALVTATAGSTLGFMTAYGAGRYFEQHVVEGRFSRFLPVDTIARVEAMFRRYGYGVIVANRFLAGTRALVSFFAGMSRMELTRTTALCALGAAIWNTILLLLGSALGSNWRMAGAYLMLYSKLVTAITVAAIIVFAVWWYLRKRRTA
jgi:membrane protein DedA with SNARE-associated domain